MNNVLIAGCGYTGTAIGCAVSDQGHTVWGLRRNPEHLPEHIRPIQADLTDVSTLEDPSPFPDEVTYILFSASANEYSDEGYRRMYVEGIRNLLKTIQTKSLQPERIFFTSSAGVYAQKEGTWVDEKSPTEPEWYAGKRMLEAENVLRESPFPHTILRLGGIYGPGRSRRIRMVKQGKAVCYEGPTNYSNMIHVRDIAGATAHLMDLSEPDSRYLLVDSNPVDRCEVYRWLADQLNAPKPSVRPRSEASIRIRRSNKRCRNDRLIESGYEFQYPSYKEGYGQILSEKDY